MGSGKARATDSSKTKYLKGTRKTDTELKPEIAAPSQSHCQSPDKEREQNLRRDRVGSEQERSGADRA